MAGHASTGRRVVITVLVLVLIAALVAGGWWLWTEYGADAFATSDQSTLSGTVEAEESQVSSVIAGRIASVSATEGAQVTAGTALFKIDDAVLAAQVKQAEAGVRAAQAALDQAKSDNLSSAEIAAAQAKLDQANAVLEAANAQLGYTTVSAATDGVITAVAANVGENASAGKALATISNLARLHVSVYVAETDIGNVKLGQSATITTDSSSDAFGGIVDFIASEAEFTPSNIETKEQRVKLVYEVRIAIQGAQDVLKPGMPVDVELQ